MEKIIILDRDGVINLDSDNYIKSVEEWVPEQDSIKAITELTDHGFKIFVATNQSGISRKFYSHNTLNAMHNKLRQLCAEAGGKISGIVYCPHGPDDNCSCRKPKPGLFEKIEAQITTPMSEIFTVGDSFRDLEAGLTAGAKPILVLTGKGERTLEEKSEALKDNAIPIKKNLLEAARHVIAASKC